MRTKLTELLLEICQSIPLKTKSIQTYCLWYYILHVVEYRYASLLTSLIWDILEGYNIHIEIIIRTM